MVKEQAQTVALYQHKESLRPQRSFQVRVQFCIGQCLRAVG